MALFAQTRAQQAQLPTLDDSARSQLEFERRVFVAVRVKDIATGIHALVVHGYHVAIVGFVFALAMFGRLDLEAILKSVGKRRCDQERETESP